MPYNNRKELHAQLEILMSQALDSDLGVEVYTNNSEHCRQELNFARRAARERGNSNFDALTFRTCPSDPENYVWIVKQVQAQVEE